jgi:hypothetical protein
LKVSGLIVALNSYVLLISRFLRIFVFLTCRHRCNLLPRPLTIPPTPNHLIIPGATTTASGVQSFEVSRQLEVGLKLILLTQLTRKFSFFSSAAIAAIFCHGH